jgi:hypothetical protein
MAEKDILTLQWTFAPTDYFEEPLTISKPQFTVKIDNGKIEASMDPTMFEQDPRIKDRIEKELQMRFRGVQLESYGAYQLNYVGRDIINANGTRKVRFRRCPVKLLKSRRR